MSDALELRKITRGRAIAFGAAAAGGIAGTLIAGCASPGGGGSAPLPSSASGGGTPPPLSANAISQSVANTIQNIIQAQGDLSNGVLNIEIDRNDITNVTLHGIPILPSFQINGNLVFQSTGGSNVMMNSDMALKESEVDPFIDQLLAHGIVFQAEHQHFYDFHPLVWFIHFRMQGDATTVAQATKAALNVTSTPFPQTMPSNPTTPLPADKIGQIIGATPTIGSDGVVNLQVPRKEQIILGGVSISPFLNVETPIAFQPATCAGGSVAVPDFGMIASEIQGVVGLMRSRGWDSGCLYNQETDEQPQLYFDHMFKSGDPIALAQEIRAALDLMNVQLS